jgi:hypothetical protein
MLRTLEESVVRATMRYQMSRMQPEYCRRQNGNTGIVHLSLGGTDRARFQSMGVVDAVRVMVVVRATKGCILRRLSVFS